LPSTCAQHSCAPCKIEEEEREITWETYKADDYAIADAKYNGCINVAYARPVIKCVPYVRKKKARWCANLMSNDAVGRLALYPGANVI